MSAAVMFQFDEAVEATTRVSGARVISPSTSRGVAVERLNVNVPTTCRAPRSGRQRDPPCADAQGEAEHNRCVQSPSGKLERSNTGFYPEVVDELVRRAREAERLLHHQRAADKQKKASLGAGQICHPSRPSVRYVFTMPGTVNVIPERADGKLTLNFDAQVNWDLADAKASLPPTLKSIEAELTSIRSLSSLSPNVTRRFGPFARIEASPSISGADRNNNRRRAAPQKRIVKSERASDLFAETTPSKGSSDSRNAAKICVVESPVPCHAFGCRAPPPAKDISVAHSLCNPGPVTAGAKGSRTFTRRARTAAAGPNVGGNPQCSRSRSTGNC